MSGTDVPRELLDSDYFCGERQELLSQFSFLDQLVALLHRLDPNGMTGTQAYLPRTGVHTFWLYSARLGLFEQTLATCNIWPTGKRNPGSMIFQ